MSGILFNRFRRLFVKGIATVGGIDIAGAASAGHDLKDENDVKMFSLSVTKILDHAYEGGEVSMVSLGMVGGDGVPGEMATIMQWCDTGAAHEWFVRHNISGENNKDYPIFKKFDVWEFKKMVGIQDDDKLRLPINSSGFGRVSSDDNANYADFVYTDGGAVALSNTNGSVANSDSDTDLSIYISGDYCYIRNRLGSNEIFYVEVNMY